ncbi:MFS general substrate transporter [Hyaloscypha variabilis F]|uniref:MFS general substrate transporter n=1 Tax=Hyaloscypha variabilis (strain UAMH 11265 / GT02V1 / F) TaxID=1149755 RepID=A0A2J6QRK7_HYAVF|nr:MFS general substrate transporter [Hyaloscypha variabilis F]
MRDNNNASSSRSGSSNPAMSPNDPSKGGKPEVVTWMSLPHKPQLFILAICRLSEPLSNTCLLPYLYYLIRSLQTSPDTSPASISRQAGLLVSLFAFSQFATSVPWASVANRLGRKPSIVIGLVLSIVSNIGFGFSTSIPAVMCWRVLAGIGNGNTGVMRTMTAEIVKERKYQSRAFLLLPLVFNSGVVIGLALGGCLADPIVNLPWLFGPTGVWNFGKDPEGVAWMRAYPFALPTLFNAAVLSISLFFGVFFLKETMPGKTDHKDYGIVVGEAMKSLYRRIFHKESGSGYGYASLQEEDLGNEVSNQLEPPTPKTPGFGLSITSRAIYTREVLVTIVSFGLLPLHNSAFMQVFPVFLSTPYFKNTSPTALKFNGGLGMSSPTIGLFLSAFGIFGILIQLCIYPSLQAWLGTLRSYRVALAVFPIAYIVAPYLCLIPETNVALQSLGIVCILFLQVTARTFGIPSSVILLTNSAPTPLALGAVHGVGNMISSLARAVGPLIGGVIFGFGHDIGVVGTVWWGYLMVISVLGLAWSWMLKEGERPREMGRGAIELGPARKEVDAEKGEEGEKEALCPK